MEKIPMMSSVDLKDYYTDSLEIDCPGCWARGVLAQHNHEARKLICRKCGQSYDLVERGLPLIDDPNLVD